MAGVRQYTEGVLPQGGLDVRATPNAFGANVGQAVSGLGETLRQNEIQSDVTNVHVTMAKQRAAWQQKLTDMANEAQPGDDTFVPRVMSAMQQEFEGMAETVKTRQGQQAFARLSADMTSMFGQEAIGIQSRLNGEFAKNQYTDLSKSLSSVAAKDHSQVDGLIKQGLDAINDPEGRFARVPESTREAFRRSIKEEIEYSAAQGFTRRFPNAVLGQVPSEVRAKVQEGVSKPPTPGLPPDLKADTVKPYDQGRIDTVAKRVAQPSPYDKAFQDAARLYNLDWRELKMRGVAESGLDPKAKSSQNAGGIMQLTPETAARLGVNRDDPVASIFAAAKLIADYRTKAGGDMSKVDMMYYGGESGKAWGPNTKQYAANLSATRVAVGLGTGVLPEQFATSDTVQAGDSQGWVKPKTGIGFIDNLPADKYFSVLTQAEHYQRAYDAQSERSRIEQQHQQQAAAEAAMDNYTQRIVNPNKENGGKISEVEIVSNPLLNAAQKQHMLGYLAQSTREKQAGQEAKTNPGNVRELMLRIHAPDNDPGKIYNNEPIYQALSDGKISTNEFAYLNREVTELKSSSTNGFRRDVNSARGQVARALQQNVELQAMEMANPGTMADISYRFDRDLEAKIEALRKQNKDPSVLLDPDSKDYVLKPGALKKFFPGNTVSQAAGAAVVAQASQLPTYKEYDSLKSGASYTDPQGNVRVKR
jgi:hypothetical protein